MEELLLLKILLNKEEYIKYSRFIESINLENEPKIILNCIAAYYEAYPNAESISLDELKTYFFMLYPLYKDRDSYAILFSNLANLEINNKDLLDKTLSNLIERYYASDIVESLTQVLSGTRYGLLPDIEHKLKEFYSIAEKKEEESPFIDSNLSSLLEEEVNSDGIKWRLQCLNQDIGDLRGYSLGHVYARPDSGKTTFLASEVTFMAEQLKDDEIILWCNNEEKGNKVKLRTYCAALDKTKEDIANSADQSELDFKLKGGDKIKIYDSALITISDIEAMLKQYNVRILIIDQGDKVKFRGDKDMALHERLKRLYGIYRELAKEYCCDIITVGQASASAEGVQWLQLDDMDSSKVGKPGELDYAVAIGFNPAEGKELLRFLHIAKNKMKNGVHGKHIVKFDPLRARYRDIGYEPYNQGGMNATTSTQPLGDWHTVQPHKEGASYDEATNTAVY